jgi:hypothetical protein
VSCKEWTVSEWVTPLVPPSNRRVTNRSQNSPRLEREVPLQIKWSWVPTELEKIITVLARTSSNCIHRTLHVPTDEESLDNDIKCFLSDLALTTATGFMFLSPWYRTPLIIGSQPNVTVSVTVWNSGDPAFLAYAVISLPASCPLARAPGTCQIFDVYDDDDDVRTAPRKELKCLIGNPLSSGMKVSSLPALSTVWINSPAQYNGRVLC